MRTTTTAVLLLAAGQVLAVPAAMAAAPKDLRGSWTIKGLSSGEGFCIEANSGYYPVTVDRNSVNSASSKCQIVKLTASKDLPGSYSAELRCSLAGGKPFDKVEGWLLVIEKGQKSWVRMVAGSTPTTWEPCTKKAADKNTPETPKLSAKRKIPLATDYPSGGDEELAAMSEDITAGPAKPKAKPEDSTSVDAAEDVSQGAAVPVPRAKTTEPVNSLDRDLPYRCDDGSTLTYVAATAQMKINRRDGFTMSLPFAGNSGLFSYWGLGENAYSCEKAPCAVEWAPAHEPARTYYMVEQGKQVNCTADK